MGLLEPVRRAIESKQLLPKGATIVVGVSGGADSLCLLHLLSRLRADYGWSLCVAHLNHRLRGDEADADMVFVALLAVEWALPCFIQVVDVKAEATRRQMSIEEAARQVRYGFLSAVANQVGAQAVAVGHNADDQSETVLMHFLRGTGLAGLRGMSLSIELQGLKLIQDSTLPAPPAANVQLVRPLLAVPRAEIESYCAAHDLSPCLDRTNLDTTYFRNRLRHQLLPLLETFNPNVKTLLRRTAAVVAADYQLLTDLCDQAWKRLVKEENTHEIRFDLKGWRVLPLALRRATLRQAAYRLRPGLRDVDFCHIQQAVAVATDGDTGAQATLPQGLRLTVDYQTLRMSTAQVSLPPPDWPLLWRDEVLPVVVPGETQLPNGWRLETRFLKERDDRVLNNHDRWTAYLDAARLGANPALRRRRGGDRFQPLGMGGHTVKVADMMVNDKIPRNWREHIPLLTHDRPASPVQEEIAWLVGWRIDERVKVTDQTRQVIQLCCYRAQSVKG